MIHHTAIAVKDVARSHKFYTEVMGFELAKVVKRQTPIGGWTKHIFYDIGGGALHAIWDLRGLEESGKLDPESWRGGMSTGVGLPYWINHLAFNVSGPEEFEQKKQRWLDHGQNVAEVDHEFIRSIYTRDPDGTLVEWTYATRPLNDDDKAEALRLLADDTPATQPDYEAVVHRPKVPYDVGAPAAPVG